jgi:alkylated DNA repair dioxygenase AlkB
LLRRVILDPPARAANRDRAPRYDHEAMETTMLPMFEPVAGCEVIPVVDGGLALWAAAFSPSESRRLFDALRCEIDWRHEEIVVAGQRHAVPRLVAWHADTGLAYRYSGTTHVPEPWTAALDEIRGRISALAGQSFNSVLLNLYRDGRDGMGWHADAEPELGRNPVIGSVSLGAPRRFRLKHRRHGTTIDLTLPDGSLLVMSGPLQHHWLHSLPKTSQPTGARINLTFRTIFVVDAGDVVQRVR